MCHRSGDLANGNAKRAEEREHQIAIEAQDPNFLNDEDQVDSICPPPGILQLTNVKNTERNKFFGSLPNHLDSDETYRENGKQLTLTNYYHMYNLTNILFRWHSLQQKQYGDTKTSI